jgi:hypothetical protein
MNKPVSLQMVLIIMMLANTGCVVPPVSQTATPAAIQNKDPGLPFYGIEFVPTEDLKTVRALGVEVVGQTFAHDGRPADWLDQLDQAEKYQIKIIAWLWPQGWTWEGEKWVIDGQAQSFLQTVAGHKALFAVYALNEPYWQNCPGCGFSTSQQQALYAEIKAIKDVPIFSAVDSMNYWTKKSKATAFADGICDYCATWYYPFSSDGYERKELKKRLEADLKTARKYAPNSKIVWYLQAFVPASSDYRMPTAEEMEDLASIVYGAGVDGAMWYVWTFNPLYSDYLSLHQELHSTVKEIHETTVLPLQ